MATAMPTMVDQLNIAFFKANPTSPRNAPSLSSNIDNLIDAILAVEGITVGPLVFNVKAYGAKGDGVTDDRVAIQAAIDDASSTIAPTHGALLQRGGEVYFPPGIYNVSSPGLNMDTSHWGVSLRGAGTQGYWYGRPTSVLDYTGTSGHLLSCSSGHDNTFSLLGFNAANASYSGDLVLAGSTGADGINLTWDRCIFTNTGASVNANCALRFDRQIICKVHKCGFVGNFKYGLALSYNSYSVANTVDDCFFRSSQIAHIYFGAGYVQAMRIHNNTFEPRADNSAGSVLVNTGLGLFIDGLEISNNWFGDIAADGGQHLSIITRGCTVFGNFFGWAGTGAPAIKFPEPSSGFNCMGNDFYSDVDVDFTGGCQRAVLGANYSAHDTFTAPPADLTILNQAGRTLLPRLALQGAVPTHVTNDLIAFGSASAGAPPTGRASCVAWYDTANPGYFNLQGATTSDATAHVRLWGGQAGAVKVETSNVGVGFNGSAPVGKQTLGAAATDLASVLVLANNLRTALINDGLGVN